MPALLAKDHYDAGANRVVDVLEELRSGLMNKLHQAHVMQRESWSDAEYTASTITASVYRAVIDDIALFIQREQRS